MQRINNWESVLAATIEGLQDKQFQYGTFDCCLAANAIILAITGTNLMLGMGYNSEDEARKLIQSLGSDLLAAVAAIAEQNELESIPPSFAQRGDLAVAIDNGKQIVGVVGTDARYVVCAAATGTKNIERSNIVAAWRV